MLAALGLLLGQAGQTDAQEPAQWEAFGPPGQGVGRIYTPASGALLALPDNTQTLNTAKVRVRVVNAVEGGAPVNLLVNFTMSATNVAAASASRYVELDQGTYNISVSSASSGATLFNLSGYQFDSDDAGKLYAILLTGSANAVQGVLVADG